MDYLYTMEIFDFLRTVTIKASFIADQIKNTLINSKGLTGLLDEENPYYLNMCGEYSSDDSIIYIESVDTNTTIAFNKENLLTHPKTALKYKLPNKKFRELCNNNPTQKHLIEAIVYPVKDISTAISAKTFDILNYDASLLQVNERDSMVQCLYDSVKHFKNNFYIEEFFYENTYPIVMWDFMWKYIAFSLYMQRINNIKTPAVHVYHIWSYLTAMGIPDHRSVLNLEQQLWLYKNIDYLFRNRGKNKNLQLLAENILSTYAVELRQKSVFLNYKAGEAIPKPIIEIVSEDIYADTTPTQNLNTKYETLPYFVKREYDNKLRPSKDDNVIADTDATFTRASSTYHPTRIIEINKKPIWEEYEPFYTRFILENYLYNFKENVIDYKIPLELASTGGGKAFTIGECYALFSYCLHLQNSRNTDLPINLENVIPNPELEAEPKLPIYIPTCAYVNTVFVKGTNPKNETMKFQGIKYVNIEQHLNKVANFPILGFSSPENFMTYLEERFLVLYGNSLEQRSLADEFFYEAFENTYKPHVLVGKLDVTFVEGYDQYEDWFESNIELKNLITGLHKTSDIELEIFLINLIEKVFPSELMYDIVKSKTLLNDKYLKLKKLFMSLCSYTVGFVDTRDDDEMDMLTSAHTLRVDSEIHYDYYLPMISEAIFKNVVNSVQTTWKTDGMYENFESTLHSTLEENRNLTLEMTSSGVTTEYVVRHDLEMDISAETIVETYFDISTIDMLYMGPA